MLRGSVSVVQATTVSFMVHNRVPSKDKRNRMYDYHLGYSIPGTDSSISCPSISISISIVQSTRVFGKVNIISVRNTITPSECKGLIGQM